jgi:hypothetical protein
MLNSTTTSRPTRLVAVISTRTRADVAVVPTIGIKSTTVSEGQFGWDEEHAPDNERHEGPPSHCSSPTSVWS